MIQKLLYYLVLKALKMSKYLLRKYVQLINTAKLALPQKMKDAEQTHLDPNDPNPVRYFHSSDPDPKQLKWSFV